MPNLSFKKSNFALWMALERVVSKSNQISNEIHKKAAHTFGLHARRTHRRRRHSRDSRNGGFRGAFLIREGRCGFEVENERPIRLFRYLSGKRRHGKLSPILRRPRSRIRALLRIRHVRFRFSPHRPYRMILERARNQLFRGDSGLRKAQTQSREVQGVGPFVLRLGVRGDSDRPESAVRLSGGRHGKAIRRNVENRQLLPNRRRTAFGVGIRRRELSGRFYGFGFRPREGSVIPEPYRRPRRVSRALRGRSLSADVVFRLRNSGDVRRNDRIRFETPRQWKLHHHGQVRRGRVDRDVRVALLY